MLLVVASMLTSVAVMMTLVGVTTHRCLWCTALTLITSAVWLLLALTWSSVRRLSISVSGGKALASTSVCRLVIGGAILLIASVRSTL